LPLDKNYKKNHLNMSGVALVEVRCIVGSITANAYPWRL